MKISMDNNYNVSVAFAPNIPGENAVSNQVISIDGGGFYGGGTGGGFSEYDEFGDDGGGSSRGSLMSSWLFTIGTTGVVLAASIVLGVLLAKKRIKKGIDVYED